MKLILDEDLPRGLLAQFQDRGHQADHVEDLGWKGIRNGELLRRISGQYDVLLTGDTNMHQQNLARSLRQQRYRSRATSLRLRDVS